MSGETALPNKAEMQELTLAGGVLSMRVPEHWEGGRVGFDEAHFRIGRIGLSAILECYDVPDEIENNGLGKFMLEPDMPIPELPGDTRFESLTIRYTRAYHDQPLLERVWKRAHVISPERLRIGVWILSMPDEDPENLDIEELSEQIDSVVRAAEFAPRLLPADLVAASSSLKRTAFWDWILMRVPAHWTREKQNPDGTGMYCVHEEGAETGTLWVDYDSFEAKGDAPVPELLGEWARAVAEDLKGRPGHRSVKYEERNGEHLVTCVFPSVEDGETLRHIAWHRFVYFGPILTVAHFTLVFLERVADQPDFIDRLALFDREVRSALLIPPEQQ